MMHLNVVIKIQFLEKNSLNPMKELNKISWRIKIMILTITASFENIKTTVLYMILYIDGLYRTANFSESRAR